MGERNAGVREVAKPVIPPTGPVYPGQETTMGHELAETTADTERVLYRLVKVADDGSMANVTPEEVESIDALLRGLGHASLHYECDGGNGLKGLGNGSSSWIGEGASNGEPEPDKLDVQMQVLDSLLHHIHGGVEHLIKVEVGQGPVLPDPSGRSITGKADAPLKLRKVVIHGHQQNPKLGALGPAQKILALPFSQDSSAGSAQPNVKKGDSVLDTELKGLPGNKDGQTWQARSDRRERQRDPKLRTRGSGSRHSRVIRTFEGVGKVQPTSTEQLVNVEVQEAEPLLAQEPPLPRLNSSPSGVEHLIGKGTGVGGENLSSTLDEMTSPRRSGLRRKASSWAARESREADAMEVGLPGLKDQKGLAVPVQTLAKDPLISGGRAPKEQNTQEDVEEGTQTLTRNKSRRASTLERSSCQHSGSPQSAGIEPTTGEGDGLWAEASPGPTEGGAGDGEDSEDEAMTASGGFRRKHHRAWTLREVTTLVEGVAKCGNGKWADIKNVAFPSMSHRTAVDLKDKWRNLLRASQVSAQHSGKEVEPRKNKPPPIPSGVLARVRELAQQQAEGGNVSSAGSPARSGVLVSRSGRTVLRR